MKRTFVLTGGFGFVGQALLRQFDSSANRVIVVDNLCVVSSATPERFENVVLLKHDVRYLKAAAFENQGPTVWIHLAAIPFIPFAIGHPLLTLDTNVLGTVNVCRVAHEVGANRFVLVSSGEIYGSGSKVAFDEGAATEARSLYAMSKLLSEKVVRDYPLRSLPWTIVRPFNAYGPNATHPYFVPEMIRQCVRENTIRVGSLNKVRDFTHVDDTARAIRSAALTPGIEGETFNICSEVGWSMKDVLSRITNLCGARSKPIEIERSRIRPDTDDPDYLVGSASHAKDLLGWSPQIPLEVGLQRTIDAYHEGERWPYENLLIEETSLHPIA